MTIPSRVRAGFTLIELLVVIAIIGILSSVVMASLTTARDKGNDAAIKENLNTIAVQATQYYDANQNTYADDDINNSCTGGMFSDQTIAGALSAADTENGAGPINCFASTDAYAIQVKRIGTTVKSTYWCIDSSGIKCGINSGITGTSCGSCISHE